MATKKQKEELMEILKFTPRTYTVNISGYGGEIAMGRIDLKTVEYFKKNKISVSEYASSWGEPGDDDYIEVPENLEPFPQGSWYECDNIEHNSGAEFGGATITVYDENGNEVWEQELGHNLEDHGCEVECFCCEDIEDYCDDKTGVFVGQSFEKGGFFEAELELKQPFDPAKFKFTYSDIANWAILNVVEYDGEELDGSNGYGTTGKSSSFTFYYRNQEGDVDSYEEPSDDDDDDIPVLEGEEEWAQRAIDEHSSFATLAQTLAEAREEHWNTTDVKPPAKGEYEVKFVQGVWPSGDVRPAEWTGRSWKENGKKAPEMIGWREIDE